MVNWDQLVGDDQQRECHHCKTPIYSLSEFSDHELIQIKRQAGGKLCGKEARPASKASRRGVLFGLLLSLVSPLRGQSGKIRFRLLDPNDAVIAHSAMVTRIAADGKDLQAKTTSETGEVSFEGLAPGLTQFRFTAPGFLSLTRSFPVRDEDTAVHQVTLTVDKTCCVGVVIIPKESPLRRWFRTLRTMF